jgi:hypothetical protein
MLASFTIVTFLNFGISIPFLFLNFNSVKHGHLLSGAIASGPSPKHKGKAE